jgi:leucine dehydrogenase
MCVFSSPSFDHHELVTFTEDPVTGLKAIIAVHNSNLGPAVGGCRMFPYANDADALEDVLRLSRGMTYKSALAGLPMGGGKAVIIGDHRTQKSPALLEKMGDFIEAQGGKYITAEDSGTNVKDMQTISRRTKHVSGVDEKHLFGGDPSPFTAYGIYCGMKAALKHKNGNDDLSGVRVAIQGAGVVGQYLADLLLKDGAKVFVADINQENLDKAAKLGDDQNRVEQVDVDKIIGLDVDVFAPCAMGAVLNDESIPTLKASIVAGGANNQLAEPKHGELLRERGILYAPDYVINAGGIIEIHHQRSKTPDMSRPHIAKIGDTLTQIFKLSDQQNKSTADVADQLAEERFKNSAKVFSEAYAVSNNA